ncbi:hypothetical protein [Sphingomonas colocasiae]|uniref:TonB-dependent receptor n=1 Tax=Sphingomonas colocasiae TaxID=1848973 RepID=A0ABS7PVW4_9SPHN|nr:hypothetical protein [Sphingomonas colocasiae]MBY8825094.1 hypothetical protein [Sphingomonas colocasiae]
MKAIPFAAFGGLALFATIPFAPALFAQDGAGEIVVTAQRLSNSVSPIQLASPNPPVIGLKRMADSAVRTIEIVSDSREAGMRRREVQAMLLDAIDRAKRDGFNLVTGQFELVEVTRANWQDQFPGLAGKPNATEDDEDEDDEDEDDAAPAAFEDDGSTATVRLKVKTKLDGSIGSAQQKIGAFVKSVPANGRAQIQPRGGLALTIINPEQYRDEIYRRIAAGAKHANSFYGPDYGLDVTGLDQGIAWKQVSNTEVFLYIPYGFSIRK